ncbi:MAG: hypothetical protein C0475_06465 [Planctomyces sp.]|nr:hypothetical protein [Planctomyces sp.]MBA4039879.1 hypothetical protein [Planctomyces sp.]MBA4120070.1 hypothetical protein [Isosphaera sp.]
MSGDIPTTAYTRRQFVHGGLVLASASVTLPAFLSRSALALPRAVPGAAAIPGVDQDRVLVVVQLSGGNDGLNTVVPYFSPDYYRARGGIGIREDRVLKLDKAAGVGLHPAMAGMAELYNEGMVTVVQGVGYPNPNRSHFQSMDVWHTADTSGTGDGWLGKYFDAECCGYGKGESGRPDGSAARGTQLGLAIGAAAPLAMRGRTASSVSFESPELFRWSGGEGEGDLGHAYDMITRAPDAVLPGEEGSNVEFLTRTTLDARVSSELIRKAVATRPMASYPANSPLTRQLQMVAAMIRAGLPTRVYYTTLGGFDTHSGQGGEQGRHAQLLGQLSGAVRAFYQDLKASGHDAKTMTMCFSEFGRRVGQNASNGTDHGTAAPMFMIGPMVRKGVLNDHPSLTDLDSGDLKYTLDFRSVYAGVLGKWLQAQDPAVVLGKGYKPVEILRWRG